MIQHKKIILFSVIAISAFCFLSCGKDTKKPLSSSQNTETQTSLDTSDINIKNTTKDSDDDSQGKQSSSDIMATALRMDSASFFYQLDPLPKIIYSHIHDDSEFGKEFISLHKSLESEDVEYLIFLNEEGYAEYTICWICSYDKKYVGCGGKMESKDEIEANNWDEVLAYFGLKEGEYTNIYSNTTKVSDDDSQGKKSSSRTMASGIGMEFFCNESPLPDMVYGHIRDNSEFGNYFFSIHKSLDEDVEYIAFVNEEGFAEDVLCWICSYEKKYVGIAKKYDSNMKDDFENWDEVLAYYGLKEGEYTNIYS